jgi:hypothetical protein
MNPGIEQALGLDPRYAGEALVADVSTAKVLDGWNLDAEASTPEILTQKLGVWAGDSEPEGLKRLARAGGELGILTPSASPRMVAQRSQEAIRFRDEGLAVLSAAGSADSAEAKRAIREREMAQGLFALANGAMQAEAPSPEPRVIPEQAVALGLIQERLAGVAGRLATQARNAVRGSIQGHEAPAPTVSGAEPGKGYARRMEAVLRLSSDEETLADLLVAQTEGWQEHAPGTAISANATTVRALGHLRSVLPQAVSAGPLMPEIPPSASALAGFRRAWDAVDDPFVIMREATAGTLTSESVQAVQSVYPALYERMQAAVVNSLTENKGREVPYRQRMMLSTLLGQDMDGMMSGNFIVASQISYLAVKGRQAMVGASQGQPMPKDHPSLAKRTRTEMQSRQDQPSER